MKRVTDRRALTRMEQEMTKSLVMLLLCFMTTDMIKPFKAWLSTITSTQEEKPSQNPPSALLHK